MHMAGFTVYLQLDPFLLHILFNLDMYVKCTSYYYFSIEETG